MGVLSAPASATPGCAPRPARPEPGPAPSLRCLVSPRRRVQGPQHAARDAISPLPDDPATPARPLPRRPGRRLSDRAERPRAGSSPLGLGTPSLPVLPGRRWTYQHKPGRVLNRCRPYAPTVRGQPAAIPGLPRTATQAVARLRLADRSQVPDLTRRGRQRDAHLRPRCAATRRRRAGLPLQRMSVARRQTHHGKSPGGTGTEGGRMK
jgi:hypothetical protein